MMQFDPISLGSYQTAAEASPNKHLIDQWLNEGKSCILISKMLKDQTGEYISDKGINKYKKYREEKIRGDLEKDPTYQGQIQMLNEKLITGIGKIKEIDVMTHLADTIEQSAKMLKVSQVAVNDAKDYKSVADTLLKAIEVYGNTVLKAQRFSAIRDDPSLLQKQEININIKSALSEILKGAIMGNGDGNGFSVIDGLRAGIGHIDGGGYTRDTGGGGSGIVDGEESDPEGSTILIQREEVSP